jgi:hypothetical protein
VVARILQHSSGFILTQPFIGAEDEFVIIVARDSCERRTDFKLQACPRSLNDGGQML